MILTASSESDAVSGAARVMLRSGRVICGPKLVVMHLLAVAVLCAVSTDTDMCVAMFTANHVFR